MNDWIGLAIIGFIVLCALLALWQLSKPYEVSVEEFEKRAAEAPSLLSAGFVGLQKILDPATAKAVEAQEDLKQGRYDKKQAKGDGDEAGKGDEEQEAGADGRRQEQEQEQEQEAE
jgi:hypothetical protein